MALTAVDDHRHNLKPGEHEALYFLFTSADGKAHGFVCTLFARDSVLERVTLRQTAYRLTAWHLARRVRTVPGTATGIVELLE